MKKVKKFLAVALMTLTVLSVSALPASASSRVIVPNTSATINSKLPVTKEEYYLKVWNSDRNTLVALNPMGDYASLGRVTSPSSNGSLTYFQCYRKPYTYETLIHNQYNGAYSVRRGSSKAECGAW